MSEQKTERRKFKRVPVNFILFYKIHEPIHLRMFINKEEICAVMLDLTEGGMAILTTYDIPAVTILSINFMLIDTTATKEDRVQRMEILGEVRYNLVQDHDTRRLGIQFTRINETDRAIIASFCRKAASQ